VIKAYLIGGSIIVTTIFILSSFDSKEVAKTVAKSEYTALEKRFEKLQEAYKKSEKRNKILESENERLQGRLKKYKNGFKSMYE
jgi:predicted RNase H-like nuclease (RuvC/YqgF family)